MPDSRLTIGNFSNDDGDANEDVKEAKLGTLVPRAFPLIRFITQNNNFACAYHPFLYISLLSLHDYDVKMTICKFFGGRKQATTNLFFSL